MKKAKFLVPVALLGLLFACGGNETETTTTEATTEAAAPAEEAKPDRSSNPDYQKGLALIAKNDCLTCHKVDEVSIGPSYKSVAAKYTGAADTTINRMAEHIVKGGSGIWGAVPMTPHPTLSMDDAKQMVKYVLLLNE